MKSGLSGLFDVSDVIYHLAFDKSYFGSYATASLDNRRSNMEPALRATIDYINVSAKNGTPDSTMVGIMETQAAHLKSLIARQNLDLPDATRAISIQQRNEPHQRNHPNLRIRPNEYNCLWRHHVSKSRN